MQKPHLYLWSFERLSFFFASSLFSSAALMPRYGTSLRWIHELGYIIQYILCDWCTTCRLRISAVLLCRPFRGPCIIWPMSHRCLSYQSTAAPRYVVNIVSYYCFSQLDADMTHSGGTDSAKFSLRGIVTLCNEVFCCFMLIVDVVCFLYHTLIVYLLIYIMVCVKQRPLSFVPFPLFLCICAVC